MGNSIPYIWNMEKKIDFDNPGENYSRRIKYLSADDLKKLDVAKFFPFHERDDYYNKEGATSQYAGLEYMPQVQAFDLFSWDADDNDRATIKAFQDHCKKRLGWIPICNNY